MFQNICKINITNFDLAKTLDCGQAFRWKIQSDGSFIGAAQGFAAQITQNGDEITIIDYKTDFIHSISQLKTRYEKQLELYRHGAKQLFDTDKVKCILYSFHLDEYTEF
ncbi:MAG: hypothetical protein J6A76_00155 [Oscillospiraceae bacterium]|nr:hypothetical protein [Oscillospiraceae bacterium]